MIVHGLLFTHNSGEFWYHLMTMFHHEAPWHIGSIAQSFILIFNDYLTFIVHLTLSGMFATVGIAYKISLLLLIAPSRSS